MLTILAFTYPNVPATAEDLTVDMDTFHVDATNHSVGIETLYPDANVHVEGNIYVSDDLTVAKNPLHVEAETERPDADGLPEAMNVIWSRDDLVCKEQVEIVREDPSPQGNMACFVMQQHEQTYFYAILNNLTESSTTYLSSSLEFVSDVIRESRKNRANIFMKLVWVLGDDGSIGEALIKRLQSSGAIILAHSVRPAIQNLVTFVPNFHYIQSRGFKEIVSRVANASTVRGKCVFWRGSTTGLPCLYGIWSNCTDSCQNLPRVKLVQASLDTPWLDFGLTQISQICDSEVSSNQLREQKLVTLFEKEESWLRCLGLLEIDGNADAWGSRWRQETDSVIFTVKSNFVTYFSRYFQPGIHYVEISRDLSDLVRKTKIILSTADEEIQHLLHLRRNVAAASKQLTYSNIVKEVTATILTLLQKVKTEGTVPGRAVR